MFDKALMKLAGMRGALVVLAVSSVVQGALVLGQAVFLARAITGLWLSETLSSQVLNIAAFAACLIVRAAISSLTGDFVDRYAVSTASTLHERVLRAAFDGRNPLAHETGTAAAALAATEHIDEIEDYIRILPPKMAAVVGISLPLLAALFALDWISGLIALITLPVTGLFMVMLGRQAQERAKVQFQADRKLSNRFVDALRGIDVIHAFGATGREGEGVRDASERLRVTTVRTLSVATLSGAMLDLICVIGVAAIAMMLAFRLLDETMALENALTVLMIAPEFYVPVRSFASNFHASLDGKNALGSILTLLEARAADCASPLPSGASSRWNASSVLSLDHASVDIGDGAFALRDVSLEFRGFEKVAIVGASGAGKTTLVNMIAGLQNPTRGGVSACLSGRDGDDAGKLLALDDPAWREQIHYIPQHPHLFNASLEDNIRFYRPSASRADVERVVELVGLGELVRQLPRGLESPIGEGGRGLSGGQAHRVALARVLLDERAVILFDEPTAHLDVETEYELKQRMLPCMEGRLVVFATHRLHWLHDMDRVVVLENGEVAEVGTPSELLAANGALCRLARNVGAEVRA